MVNEAGSIRLDGKVALVTGAGQGLGVGIALALVKAGASVGLVGRTIATLEQTAASIVEAGGRCHVCRGDVTDRASVDAFVAEIVADEAIHSKVEPEVWGDAMAVLVEHVKADRPCEGMAQAVQKIGELLAGCLPARHENPNELPYRLIEL